MKLNRPFLYCAGIAQREKRREEQREIVKKNIPITKRPLYYWILSNCHGLQLLLLILILVSLFFRVFPLEMQKRIVNEAISYGDLHALFLYCGLYMGAILLAGLSKYAINMVQVIIGQRILIKLRTELYLHILHLPLRLYRSLRPGSAISAMTAELNAIGLFLGEALAVPLTSVLTYIVVLGYMFSLNRLLTLLTIAIYPVELIVIPLLQKRFNNWNKKRIKTVRAMSDTVNEAINGIIEIQSYNAYDHEKNRLTRLIDKLYHISIKLHLYKFGIKFSGNLFQAIGPFLLFLVGGVLTIQGEFDLGALVAFLSAHEKLYDPWQELRLFYQSYQNAIIRYQQITNLFDYRPALPAPVTEEKTSPDAVCIETNRVSYTLPGNITLLHDIDITIKKGEHIALIGPSGCGKSTLALVLAGLHCPTEGTVRINGRDLSSCSSDFISENIAMVPQHPFIFSGTIGENILYGLGETDLQDPHSPKIRARVRAILHEIGLEKDILWFGMNSILPPEKAHKLKNHFLKMRTIIREKLKQDFQEVVEFYDRNRFLEFATLRDNLIFGESMSGRYSTENLPDCPEFRVLVQEMDLEEDLLRLGAALVRVTLEMIKETDIDEFFFQNNPIKHEELSQYEDITRRLDSGVKLTSSEKNRLMRISLRYIPAKHNLIVLNRELRRKILQARFYFLSEIQHIDTSRCELDGDQITHDGELRDFSTYCHAAYLYNRNIRTNILLGSAKKTNEDIMHLRDLAWDTFRRYGLLEEIIDIGLDFFVGSQGSHLSGGQKQKVAIARALLNDTPILIMDEATASLDNTSQALIQDYLSSSFKTKKTIIAVIHRLDLTPSYDRILVMDNGTVVENGDFDSLIKHRGIFYELYHLNHT